MAIDDRKFKRLTLENVNRAPRKQGVYALYAHQTLVFLGLASGRAETIRSRLRAHLDGLAQGVTRYKREPSTVPQARLKELLAEHVAAHGALPVQNRGPKAR
ncbi:MAG TPA: hypothetical protein VND21_06100 [Planctomycetota bacterium]|jgi:hypothetical protein|nr:hypothetical protein [Planctomycetota bacterium]